MKKETSKVHYSGTVLVLRLRCQLSGGKLSIPRYNFFGHQPRGTSGIQRSTVSLLVPAGSQHLVPFRYILEGDLLIFDFYAIGYSFQKLVIDHEGEGKGLHDFLSLIRFLPSGKVVSHCRGRLVSSRNRARERACLNLSVKYVY